MAEKLGCVIVLSNPMRFQSRYRLYERFIRKLAHPDLVIATVELVYDDRITWADRITDSVREALEEARFPHVDFIPLRIRDVLWHKEQLQGIGAQAIFSKHPDVKKIAFIDADVEFQRPDWVEATLAALDLYDVVQMWSHAVDLDPENQLVDPTKAATSFMYAYHHGLPTKSGRYDDINWHPGYCWSWRRSALEEVGGLIDTAILGAGDRAVAMSLVGKGALSYPGKISQGYKDSILSWQERAEAHIHRNVSYVPGLITHFWHGRKSDRKYASRWDILVKHQFNPFTDLRMDRAQGLWRWSHMTTPRMQRLRDDVRNYFASRREDSVDVS